MSEPRRDLLRANIAILPSAARPIAHKMRSSGFYTLPERTWSIAADLAVVLADEPPTASQLAWLAHEYPRAIATGALS